MLAALGSSANALTEPPDLAPMVESGKLPPMQERLPDTPLVVTLDGDDVSTGQYGGTLQMLMGKSKDIRMMTVYGYARLVGFNDEY